MAFTSTAEQPSRRSSIWPETQQRMSAVYPTASPGGWNLIGRCPVRMFDALADEPMPVCVGDRIQFAPIGRDEFLDLGGEA